MQGNEQWKLGFPGAHAENLIPAASRLVLKGLCIVTVTTYYKLNSVKQHTRLIVLGAEAWKEKPGLRSRCRQDSVLSGAPRGESLSLPFPATAGCPHSLISGLPSNFKASKVGHRSHTAISLVLSLSLFCFHPPLIRSLAMTLQPPQNPGYSPYLEVSRLASLISPATLSPLTCADSGNQDTGIFGGPSFCLPQAFRWEGPNFTTQESEINKGKLICLKSHD